MMSLISNTALVSVEPPWCWYTPSALHQLQYGLQHSSGASCDLCSRPCAGSHGLSHKCGDEEIHAGTYGTCVGHQDAALTSLGEKGPLPHIQAEVKCALCVCAALPSCGIVSPHV